MKLFLILFTIFSFSVGAQESKSQFWDKLHLELDYNFLPYSYQWLYTYPVEDVYLTDHASLQSSTIGILYRNRYVNGGLKVNLFNLRMVQPSLGFNTLFALKNEHYYLGPFISYGKTFGDNEFIAHQSWNVGLEGYVHSFHFGASYSHFFDFIQASSNLYKNMHGFNFQLGKSVSLFTPKSKTRKRETNVYLEANVGIIQFRHVTWSEDFFAGLGLNVRNSKYKFGIAYENAEFYDQFIDCNIGVNLLPEKWAFYFGPYLKNGIVLTKFWVSDEKRFAEFGFEAYFKNIHLTGGFARFYKAKHPYGTYELTSLNLMLGYALPLGKRVKEH